MVHSGLEWKLNFSGNLYYNTNTVIPHPQQINRQLLRIKNVPASLTTLADLLSTHQVKYFPSDIPTGWQNVECAS